MAAASDNVGLISIKLYRVGCGRYDVMLSCISGGMPSRVSAEGVVIAGPLSPANEFLKWPYEGRRKRRRERGALNSLVTSKTEVETREEKRVTRIFQGSTTSIFGIGAKIPIESQRI